MRIFAQKGGGACVVLNDRLRVDAAEVWIVFGVEGRHFATGAGEEIGEAAGAYAENFSSALGELVGKKAAVVANDDFLFRIWSGISSPMICRCLGDALDVPKIEVFSDDCPPPVSAKLDLRHARERNYIDVGSAIG